MPQLVPFYFLNEVTYTFITITIILYILSKYVLPRITNLFVSRFYIYKLFNKTGK
jgi:F-type H+-transporting ATPase subunit 8